MTTIAKRTMALAAAAVFAAALAFGLAFATPSSAQADEGSLQVGAMETQAVTTYDLAPSNSERMFKVVKASLDYDSEGQSYLNVYLSSDGCSWLYVGNQDDAAASYESRETDAKWVPLGEKVIFDTPAEYGTYDGETATANYGFIYKLPVTIAEGETSLELDITAYASVRDANDFHARHFVLDLDKKTLQAGNASDTAVVTVTSAVDDVTAAKSGTIAYTGYVRPYAGGDQANASTPLSNEWTSGLTINLGNNSIYDEAYVVTYEGSPWLKDSASVKDPSEGDYGKVQDDGTLVLPINNTYSPATTQLNGDQVVVKMHVADSAPYSEAGKWVKRTFQLSFSSRTAANLTIYGHALTPASSVQAMHRLYNPNSGEHFYTADDNERTYLIEIGWNYEGVGWMAPKTSDQPVYRLYNRSAGDHHYTPDANEREYLISVGWEDEEIGWYSAGEDGTPLYRQYNPNAKGAGSHNYTADENEKEFLIGNGWNDEGIGWYGLPADAE